MPMEVSHNEALWFFQLSKVQLSQEQDGARRIDRIATASSAAYRLADRVVRRAPSSVVFTPAIALMAVCSVDGRRRRLRRNGHGCIGLLLNGIADQFWCVGQLELVHDARVIRLDRLGRNCHTRPDVFARASVTNQASTSHSRSDSLGKSGPSVHGGLAIPASCFTA